MKREWLESAILYEVYPPSFQDSNSDGIGDLEGICARLEHIKELGCDGIWMNPCYESLFMDGGYDISNHRKVAERYGTNDMMKKLLDRAHELGLKVILDVVPGHTALNHPWFLKSLEAEENEFYGRYIWSDNIWEDFHGIKNIKGFLRGIGKRNAACAINCYSTQPALNYGFANPDKPWQDSVDSPSARATRQALFDIMKFWMDMGCDGFRVDMAGSLVKNDIDDSANIKFWQELGAEIREYKKDVVLFSEWGVPDKALQAGFELDFLHVLGECRFDMLFRTEKPYFSGEDGADGADIFVRTYQNYMNYTTPDNSICVVSGCHDIPRLAWRLDQEQLKLAFVFLMTIPGVPMIYYGDEIGMRYLEDIPSVEGAYERTGARSPMQWGDGPNSGFSNGSPETLYIPLDDDVNRPDVAKQSKDPDSLLNFVKRLNEIRHETPELWAHAKWQVISEGKSGEPLIYQRKADDNVLSVVLWPGKEKREFQCRDIRGKVLLQAGDAAFDEQGNFMMGPCSCMIIRTKG